MHYYKKNIGDYHKKAGRLNMLQHGAYNQLIDACYDRERFPTEREAIDWVWASTTDEIEAVKFVLSKFFTLTEGAFVQKRIASDLAKYHENSATNKRIAIERETKRKGNSTVRAQTVNEAPPTKHEAPPNYKPLTTNQEPLTNIEIGTVPAKRKPSKQLVKPDYMQVYEYMFSRGLDQATARNESEKFVDHFTSNGWRVGGKTPMKCWKASVRNWTKNITTTGVTNGQPAGHQQPKPSLVDRVKQRAAERLRGQEASAAGNREFGLDTMAQTDSNVRVQVCEPVRGGAGRDLGNVLEGDYWEADGGRPQ